MRIFADWRMNEREEKRRGEGCNRSAPNFLLIHDEENVRRVWRRHGDLLFVVFSNWTMTDQHFDEKREPEI